jgi:cytochrome b561
MSDVAFATSARPLPDAAARRSGDHYDRTTRVLHWTTLALLVVVFALAWSIDRHTDRDVAERLLQLHRSIGLLIWCVTVFRLARRLLGVAYVPPLPDDLPMLPRLAARLNHYALYTLLVVQPILGILHTFAHHHSIHFFLFWRMPSFAVDHSLAGMLHQMHAATATALLLLVGAHAAAALFHHFVRRDGVLRSMLPVWSDTGRE